MRNLTEIDSTQEINRLKSDSYTLISNNSIPTEALIYGSLGTLSSGYQGITAWRQLKNDLNIENSKTLSHQL